jgi:error-prone DNA polymerase
MGEAGVSGYVELRVHSAFSFGDGACTPEALVRAAAERGYGALGLTDRSDLGGAIRFALEAAKAGIRPVVGAELIIDGHPIALLARDARGFRNLAGLVTRSRIGGWAEWLEEKEGLEAAYATSASTSTSEGGNGSAPGPGLHLDRDGRVRTRATAVTPRRKPHELAQSPSRPVTQSPSRGQPTLTLSDLEGHTDGLHLLTGPGSGELASLVRAGRPEEAAFLVSRLRELFPGRMAVEVGVHHVSGEESALAGALIGLAERQGVPWVVVNDARYVDGPSRLVHDLLTALRAGLDVDTAASWGVLHPNGEWRLKSPAEMAKLWQGREAGLEASCRIAEECAFDLRWVRPPLPSFPVPPGHDDGSWLRELTYRGARERWGGEPDDRQRAQLEHELGVITRLGFAGFFLVMWDAVREARSRGILCQGRGSAANSAVAFCLGITAVDPIRHGLLFERFLSEVRTDGLSEAPDIDVDFEMHRREEILDYMYRRYGRQHAAITAVTQAYHAPTAIQDCMRALGWPAESAFPLSKRLHGREPSAGADELEAGLASKHDVDVSSPRGRALLSALRALDDVPRLRSTHPGGFVLSSQPLGDYLPIEETTMGRTILQFDKDDLDAAGVPKFDFLGLGGLTVVHTAFDAIRARTGRELELYNLPMDDPATYEMISRGDTVGTFQIESRAQIQSILQTRPSRLYDIVVQVALIRPGPIQARFVRPYTRRRLGFEEVEYADPRLEPILRRTYGIPIFQEQAMAISMAVGGYTAAEADELRRTMGHVRKLPKLQAALERLRERMVANGLAPAAAAGIAEDLHSFANYGFPESHAWSFALIAYATAWLKAHYPAEFLMALLNAWPMGFYPPATLVHEARRNGDVTVRSPCLRYGQWECTLEGDVGDMEDMGDRGEAAQREPQASEHAQSPRGGGAGSGGPPRPPVGVAGRKGGVASTHAHVAQSPRGGKEGGGGPPVGVGGEVPGSGAAPPAVRIGWKHIRGLGEAARDRLQQAAERGRFTGVADVVRRAALSRADALHLARAGAFEAFEPGRRKAAWEALRAAGDTLPLAPARHLPFQVEELDRQERVFLDYLATGICADGHPMEHIRSRLREYGVTGSADFGGLDDGAPVVIAGLVVVRQHPQTARGTVFILLEDEHGFLNLIVPPPVYDRYREVIHSAPFLLVQGRFERDERVENIVAERFRELASRSAGRGVGR